MPREKRALGDVEPVLDGAVCGDGPEGDAPRSVAVHGGRDVFHFPPDLLLGVEAVEVDGALRVLVALGQGTRRVPGAGKRGGKAFEERPREIRRGK